MIIWNLLAPKISRMRLLSRASTAAEVEPFVSATISPLLLFTHLSIQKNALNEDPDHDTAQRIQKELF
jgi:hypothetical protein